MTRELTDAEIGAVRDSFGDEPVMLYAFARAIIKADRALRVPMTEAQIAELQEDGVFWQSCTHIVRDIERHHGIGSA